MNLIENAIKFSDHKTKIRINVHKIPNRVTVSIKDQGVGIPEKNIETIFDKFSTVPSGRDGKTEGTGLGWPSARPLWRPTAGRSGRKAKAAFQARLDPSFLK